MARFAINNAELWIGDGTRRQGHVVVNGDTIEAVGEGTADVAESIDLGGAALSPGLIDLMTLGGFNYSIVRDDPRDIAREYLRLGVTSVQFCTGTLPWEAYVQLAANIKRAMDEPAVDGAEVLGIYLEGPFQHPALTGASLAENALPPSALNVGRVLDEYGDALSMINVSPGTEGDAEAVRLFREAGKIVSMAHSNAPAARVEECVAAGISVLGHVWDNNSGLLGDSGVQQPTIEHVALTDERVKFIHLICDGSHVHPVMIKLVLRARGIEALCIVTDAVPRAGMPDGKYIWDDGREFYKEGGVGRTTEGWLCGSALLLPDMLRNFVRFTGTPPHEAVRAVTYNPAASIGQEHRIGLLKAGHRANFAAWDAGTRIRRVWKDGLEVPSVSPLAEVKLVRSET